MWCFCLQAFGCVRGVECCSISLSLSEYWPKDGLTSLALISLGVLADGVLGLFSGIPVTDSVQTLIQQWNF